jgi:hypothetical protein
MSKDHERKKPDLIAYAVTGSGERSYFHRVGAAWKTKSGGARVILDAFPVNGELLLLPPREATETEEQDD